MSLSSTRPVLASSSRAAETPFRIQEMSGVSPFGSYRTGLVKN
jgi:hypothetical protein